MKKYDVVVIGGGPSGLVSAVTAKKSYGGISVALIKKEPVSVVPCGIPYMFGTLEKPEDNIMSTAGAESLGVEVIVDEVLDANRETRTLKLKGGEEIQFDKLILATGSLPVVPRSIYGTDLGNVFTVKKDLEYLKVVMAAIDKAEKVVIIGGGFIGVEIGDEIRKKGKDVTIIEALDHCLGLAFDPEFTSAAEEELKKRGLHILTSQMVKGLAGEGGVVKAVELASGEKIPADVVILSIGARPNTQIAEKLGLRMGIAGGVWTDEYMRTSEEGIFAVGDCAEHRDFFTRKPSRVMLASTASFEARIAGSNLYELRLIKENKGTIGIFSTRIGDLSLGTAGMTETVANKEGFPIITTTAESPDRHPGKISDASKVKVKLIFSKNSGILLGGQVMGGSKAIGEMVNLIGVAIQQNAIASQLATLQIGTHPLLTSAPTTYPLIIAASNALPLINSK